MNVVATTITENTVTMTSLELVEMINATRLEGVAVLLHKSFLTKVPKVPGLEMSPKFLGHIEVHGPNGGYRQSPIYRLPKREACLVAMSYSYELQARVYDRMVELEAALQKPAMPNFMGKVPKVLGAGSSANFLAHVPVKVGKAAARHDYFMVKVPKVLGERTSAEILAHVPVPGPKGAFRQSPIYWLPKRAACLVAMSYKLMGRNPPTNHCIMELRCC